MGLCTDRGWYEQISTDEYIERIMADKPERLQNDDFMNNQYKEHAFHVQNERWKWMHTNVGEISIIQFTDLHLDLDYAPGSSTTCQATMCCRK